MYRVTLSDGTVYDGLSMNGTYYVSERRVTEDEFAGKLRGVKVEYEPDAGDEYGGDSWSETYDYMKLESILAIGRKWGFTLRELTSAEIENLKLTAQVNYTAMMTDTWM